MTIASEITRINTNIANAYTACNNKGATMPATQNSANLASCVSSIPTATEPTLASLTVTPSTTAQTITPPSGTDGYNTVIASAVTASIDNNITAGNIKDGVSILGVTGTLQAGGTTPTGTIFIPANGIYDVTNYARADVGVMANDTLFYAWKKGYTIYYTTTLEAYVTIPLYARTKTIQQVGNKSGTGEGDIEIYGDTFLLYYNGDFYERHTNGDIKR